MPLGSVSHFDFVYVISYIVQLKYTYGRTHVCTHIHAQTQFFESFGYKATNKVNPLAWCLFSDAIRYIMYIWDMVFQHIRSCSCSCSCSCPCSVLMSMYIWCLCVFLYYAIVRGLQWPRYIWRWIHLFTATKSERGGFSCRL